MLLLLLLFTDCASTSSSQLHWMTENNQYTNIKWHVCRYLLEFQYKLVIYRIVQRICDTSVGVVQEFLYKLLLTCTVKQYKTAREYFKKGGQLLDRLEIQCYCTIQCHSITQVLSVSYIWSFKTIALSSSTCTNTIGNSNVPIIKSI